MTEALPFHITGLGKRISVFILSRTGNITSLIILGFLVVGAMMSMWITNMAVAAMLLPLAVSILEDEGCERLKSNFGKALLIACVWGPLIGGIGSPAGAGPNPIAIGFLKEMAGVELSFIQWMKFRLPAVFLLLPPAWLTLVIFLLNLFLWLSADIWGHLLEQNHPCSFRYQYRNDAL